MNKTRLEAFSDGVLAIIITIMVLELKVPHNASWEALKELAPVFLSYIMSFIFIGIYWGNHHHLLHTVKKVNGGIIWSNLNLLFWLSLIPFATAWMGENHFAAFTVATYAILLLLCGAAFTILQKRIEHTLDNDSHVRHALQRVAVKGYFSVIGYAAAIPFAYVNPVISGSLFMLVAVMWIIPDKRIEKALQHE
ncbi:TMEM175 family protein [Ferruginibacter albus]|uniref:TMEM175 family protein n=1 Tax=Ferruginibacter albus TaxID=2875540 RepID=UPI001CC61C61|nr:TMEM175 family protein [Ferruginibacter albus]UAY50865.1 TMEM175 family protein [Ferruginibacter albus]